ncbi:hypothetical protein [Burkholderia ubonensis]|uniref:hypothetical protein n=1 Tax=Burkholderia ubonensis TaxID=101571 RepID=UPI000759B5C9|nr:hypothetical protein [Burkholderia ubonensis]KVP17258.1 hypothetical protein WJ84_03225 [Burkholderia ubonensis]KVP39619.1 hypothetical protein WJ87_05135 [Burkholderia ubonensis]
MTGKKVVIRHDVHGERFDVEVDGESIAQFNHDEHGWAGMESAKNLVEQLGEKLGFDVVTEEGGDDDGDGADENDNA